MVNSHRAVTLSEHDSLQIELNKFSRCLYGSHYRKQDIAGTMKGLDPLSKPEKNATNRLFFDQIKSNQI